MTTTRSGARRRGVLAGLLAVMVSGLVTLGPAALAAPGALDPTFGTGGKVTTDFAGGADAAAVLIVQPDGKLVAAGGRNGDFALARYNADGSPDALFGAGGRVTTDFAGGTDDVRALVLMPDGRLVAAGGTLLGGSPDFVLARYNPDGSLDGSFGVAGKVITDFGGSPEGAFAVALQADGKVVAAGSTFTGGGTGGTADFALARYNLDGSLDSSFGVGGRVITDFGGTADGASALVLQPNGKLVAAGCTRCVEFAGNASDFALARYNADGTLDSAFGTGGKVTTNFTNEGDSAAALVLQPDGKLVAAGVAEFTGNGGTTDFALARYNPNGTPDAAFGAGGKAITDFAGGTDAARGVVLQPDGKLVAAGGVVGPGEVADFALARYNSDGSPDTTFGPANGEVTTNFGGVDGSSAAVLQPDGKVVAAGCTTCSTAGSDFALARYQGSVADLSLTKAASVQKVKSVRRVTYTLTVSNTGPDTADGVGLTDTLPAEAMFVSATPSQGPCTTPPLGETGTVACNLGSLAGSASATIQIVVDVKATGKTASVTNTAAVVSATPDPNQTNNSQTITTVVKP